MNEKANVERRAPPDWFYSLAPLDGDGSERLDMDVLIETLLERAKAYVAGRDIDLPHVLHICHVIKSEQCEDGRWPAVVNAMTGVAIGPERTASPVPLFRLLNEILDSTEFQYAVELAERGGSASNREK